MCGDRKWQDEATMEAVVGQLISKYGDEISIIHGGCDGADMIADRLALRYHLICVRVPAKWDKYGKSAGPIRNRYMLEKCKPQLVVAFHPDLWNSKGTKDMVGIASEAGIPVIHIDGPATAKSASGEFPDI